MLVAGDELGRTQRGNNNAYCQDNDLAWVDWDLADWQRDLLDFTSEVIRLRRSHQVFSRKYFFSGTATEDGHPKDLTWLRGDGQEFTETDWHFSDNRLIGMYLSGDLRSRDAMGKAQIDDSFLLILNGGHQSARFQLPDVPFGTHYRVVVDTVRGSAREGGPARRFGTSVPMPPFSTKLLRVAKR